MAKLIKEAFRLQTLAGLRPINEVGKDWDEDGTVEPSSKEHQGVVDKAIKNAIKNAKEEKAKKKVDECDGCQRSGYGAEPETRDFTGGHDHEGSMAMSELKSLQANSSRLINLIGDNAELPGWVSSYISLAADYINSVSDYLASEADQMNDGY